MDKRTYAMRYFGIELPHLTIDEKIQLEKIRNFKASKIIVLDFSDKTGKSWEIDEEFSKLCIEGSGWK